MLSRARYALEWAAENLRPTRLASGRALLPWILIGLAFEGLGRWSENDGIDGIGMLGLALFAAWCRTQHGEVLEKVWQERVEPRLRRWLEPWKLRYGIDLRERPPLPSGHPAAWCWTWVVLVAVTAGLFASAQHWPGDARLALRRVSGLGWLLCLSSLWLSLVAGGLFAITIVTSVVREHLLGAGPRTRTLLAWVLFTAGIGSLAMPLGMCLTALVLIGVFAALTDLILRPRLRVVWRPAADSDRPVRWAWGALWSAACSSSVAAVACGLILLACGDHWRGAGHSATAITNLLGILFAKAATFSFGILTLSSFVQLIQGHFFNPARPPSECVRVLGAKRQERRQVRQALGAAGLRAVFGSRRLSCPVEVQLDPGADPFELVLQRRWPLHVGLDDLHDARIHDVLRKRTATQRRRGVARGIERLMRAAASRKYEEGSGFWVAPHLWYVPAMSRDEDDGLLSAVAPPYRKLFALEARAHLFQLLRDLEIDLLFVEDGVGFRRLQRVLARLFECHDRFGPRKLESERFIRSVHGVQVILHELELGSGHGHKDYPEPDYETLGRARMLHVFRDRGGEQEHSLVPDTFDYLPLPQLT